MKRRNFLKSASVGTIGVFFVPFLLKGNLQDSNKIYITKSITPLNVKPGLNGGFFTIYLNKKLEPGDFITNDVDFGIELIIVEQYSSLTCNSFIHKVAIIDPNKNEYFLPEHLKKGTQFFKVNHTLTEGLFHQIKRVNTFII